MITTRYSTTIAVRFSSQFVFQDLVVFKGPQGEPLDQGGPQGVGKHPPDLGHVLNHAKALNPDTKLVFNTVF